MSNIDSRVADVLDHSRNDDSEDEDALIAALEDDAVTDGFREQRLQQLHSEFTRAKHQKAAGYGTYDEIKDEKELMDITATAERSVVHFSREGFARCGVMDRELEKLAYKHTDTRILKIDVDNAPFLVVKLKIQVLPCVLSFTRGQVVDRIIGFEGLGYKPDSFTAKDLETRLLGSGVILRAKGGLEDVQPQRDHGNGGIRFGVKKAQNNDSDDEWD